MKKFTIALLLLALLSSVFVACRDSGEAGTATTTTPATTPATTPETESQTVSYDHDLPDELDFDGEYFLIATWNGGNYMDHYDFGWCNFLDCDEPEAGMLLQEAAYQRNLELKNELNVEIAVEERWNWASGGGGIGTVVGLCSLAGTNTFDLIMFEEYGYEALIIDELLKDVAAMPYIDLDKGYYNQKANDVYYLRDNLYVFISDIAYPCQNAVNLLINNDMLVDLKYDPNYVYDKVDNGTWTFGVLSDMVEGLWTDVNADGKADMGDQFGLQGTPFTPCYLYPAAGVKGTYLTDDGFEFDYGTDYSLEVYDAIRAFRDSSDVYCEEWSWDGFRAGRALFAGYASEINQLQTWFDFEFGVLPYPKFRDDQEAYHTPASGGVALIPANIEDEEFVGAVVEAMACGSHKHLVPAFYDNFVENGVLRDDRSRANWERMLGEWGFYDFTKIIAPDERIREYQFVYFMIAGQADAEGGIKSAWDASKETLATICQEFYDWYLAE
jgi:hypothetical protein